MEIQCYLYRAASTKHKWGEGGGGGVKGGFILKLKIESTEKKEKKRIHENRSVSATNLRVASSNNLLIARSSELSP